MKRAIILFLRDRIGFTLAFFLNVVVILLLFSLIQRQWVREQMAYVFLLSFTIYLSLLMISFFRWYPAIKVINEKVAQKHPDAFSDLPRLGTYEQQLYREAMHHLYQSARNEHQKADQAYKEHREFIELWVHRMKLPVSALSLIIQESKPQTIEEKERLYSMMEEIEKLNEGLDIVLSMARLTDFSLDYHIRPVSLLEQVHEVIASRKKAMIRSSIYPKIVAKEGDWIILTDPKWHRFVLEQIIQNALKYTRQVKKKSQLLVMIQKKDSHIQLVIQDQGPGIPPEDLPRIYDPFFTGQNGRKYSEATGMGLYLVKKVCDQLDHSLSIHSVVGKGTTVMITYPNFGRNNQKKTIHLHKNSTRT